MMTEYAESYAEVLDIIKHMDKVLVSKIPQKMINFLTDNSAKEYKVELDYSKSLKEMELKPKTSAVLTLIFINYLCDSERKEEYISKLNENEKKYQEELSQKYSYDNLFASGETIKLESNSESEKTSEVSTESTAMIKYKEQTILDKIIQKIKQIFKKRK